MRRILLLLFLMSPSLAFNAERSEWEKKMIDEHMAEHRRLGDDVQDVKLVGVVKLEEDTNKRSKRQTTGDDLPQDVLDIFDPSMGVPSKERSPATTTGQSAPPAAGFFQNTYVPNGHQINNFFSHFMPFSPYNHGFFHVPVFVPVFLCLYPAHKPLPALIPENKPQQPQPQPQPETPDVTNPELGTKFGDTPTGISLDVVPPARPPSRVQPPLIHGESGGDSNNVEEDALVYRPPPRLPYPTTTTTTPPPRTRAPPIISGGRPSYERPATNSNVSPCVYAIANCCNLNSAYRSNCFNRFRCPGPFWGVDPCESAIANAVRETRPIFS